MTNGFKKAEPDWECVSLVGDLDQFGTDSIEDPLLSFNPYALSMSSLL